VAGQESEGVVNSTEHLLTCLAEECAEVAQRVSKALRFGLPEVQPGQEFTNEERIRHEIWDLYGVVELLEEVGVLEQRSFVVTEQAIQAKKEKIRKFMAYARERGTLSS
jgi:hypothetical protein